MAESRPDLDPELQRWLADARALEREADAAERAPALEGLLDEVRHEVKAADASPRFWLRSRPTWLRRLLALSVIALVVVAGVMVGLRSDLAELPLAWLAVGSGSLAALLGVAAWMALRPLHRPAPPRWVSYAVVALTLLSTFGLALFAPGHAPRGGGWLRELVSPCLFYGLFIGLPVFFVLRLLDRGHGLTALIGACAAGLAGNLALQLHCPRSDPEHLMAAHFMVALLFVLGLFAVDRAVRALRG